MIEIKAGNELDRAVAKAIGLELHDRGHGYGRFMDVRQWYWLKGEDPPESVAVSNALANVFFMFDPSEDLSLAWQAAEKIVGKNGAVHVCRLRDADDYRAECHTEDNYAPGCGQTPALAICYAILRLRGYDFMHGDLDAMGGLSGK